MKLITRKSMLYKTRVDYQLDRSGEPINDYAMNHIVGCSHGCKYPCYAMSQAIRWKHVKDYEEWCEPCVVENALELLMRELCSFIHKNDDTGTATVYFDVSPKAEDEDIDFTSVCSAIAEKLGYAADMLADDLLRVTLPQSKLERHHGDDIRNVLRNNGVSYRLLSNKVCPRRVHLCFTTDPLPYISWEDFVSNYRFDTGHVVPDQWMIHDLTLAACELINEFGIPVTILTKGVLPRFEFGEGGPLCMPDHDGTSKVWEGPHRDNYYGISLVSLDESFREKWEPNAAPFAKRIASLKHLHDAGCKTWVSMEPYPALTWNMGEGRVSRPFHSLDDPYAGLRFLLDRVSFVDRIVFGRWNYNDNMPCDVANPEAWYREAVRVVRAFCAERDIECVIKKGTE